MNGAKIGIRPRSRITVCLSAVAALVVIAALWLLQRQLATGPAVELPSAPVTGRAPVLPPSAPRLSATDGDSPRVESPSGLEIVPSSDSTDPGARAMAVAGIERTLQIYRDTMVYPLSSRPADGSNAHITRWNHAISLGQLFAVDRDGREIQAVAQIDRTYAAPGDAVTVQVRVTHVADGTPAKIEQIGAVLQWRDGEAEDWVTVQPIALRATDDGWIGAVTPSQIEAMRSQMREPRILAQVRDGEYLRDLPLGFTYAVTEPVVVHGIAADRVADGSLELGLDVELTQVGPVRLMATLFAGDGATPIAVFDDRYFPTKAGRQVIPVRFFGKVLHDRGVDGPYRLGAVHGYVYRRDAIPDQLAFDRADAPAMVTADYRAASFSPDAYQSPEVAARIARYEALRDGRAPAPVK